MELLRLLLDGKNRREICQLRHVEMSTVKSQIHNILKKFDKKSVEEIRKMISSMNLYNLIYNQNDRPPN